MVLEVFSYKSKDKERLGVDVESLLNSMSDFESMYGSTEKTIHDSWFSLKRQLVESLVKVEESKLVRKEGDKDVAGGKGEGGGVSSSLPKPK